MTSQDPAGGAAYETARHGTICLGRRARNTNSDGDARLGVWETGSERFSYRAPMSGSGLLDACLWLSGCRIKGGGDYDLMVRR